MRERERERERGVEREREIERDSYQVLGYTVEQRGETETNHRVTGREEIGEKQYSTRGVLCDRRITLKRIKWYFR